MAASKALPFDRVRVMAAADAGPCPPADRRRVLPELRRALERPWREPAPERAAAPAAGTAAARKAVPAYAAVMQPACEQSAAAGADQADVAPGPPQAAAWPGVQQAGQDSDPSHGAQDAPDTLETLDERPDGAPLRPPAAAAAGSPAAVAAVARSVEEAVAVNALAALLVQTCGDDAWRDTGPWQFSLQLAAIGMGDSRVDLHLSRELLSLRFHCHGPGVARVLSRHRAMLLAMLQQELRPPLDIEIVIVDV